MVFNPSPKTNIPKSKGIVDKSDEIVVDTVYENQRGLVENILQKLISFFKIERAFGIHQTLVRNLYYQLIIRG